MALTPAETIRLARLVKIINKVKHYYDATVDPTDDDLPDAQHFGVQEVLSFFYYRELVRERNILLLKQQQ